MQPKLAVIDYSKQNNIQQYANRPSPLSTPAQMDYSQLLMNLPLLPLCCSLILFPDSSSLH